MASSVGSQAARGGFSNERHIVSALNAGGSFARQCFAKMKIPETATVTARRIPARLAKASVKELLELASEPTESECNKITKLQKADIRLGYVHKGKSGAINVSLKKANKDFDFNQVDRRSVNAYQNLWEFDDDICLWLKLFTGAASQAEFDQWAKGLRTDSRRRRVAFKDLPCDAKAKVLRFLSQNKRRIISDIVRGRGPLEADYMMVTQTGGTTTRVRLCAMNDVISYLSDGTVEEGPRTAIRFGKLTIQRKGGTPDPQSLQFKMNPSNLFDVDGLTLRLT